MSERLSDEIAQTAAEAACAACDGSCGTCPYARAKPCWRSECRNGCYYPAACHHCSEEIR